MSYRTDVRHTAVINTNIYLAPDGNTKSWQWEVERFYHPNTCMIMTGSKSLNHPAHGVTVHGAPELLQPDHCARTMADVEEVVSPMTSVFRSY